MKSGVSCSGLVGIVEVEAVAVSEDIVEGDTWKGLLERRTGRERKKIDSPEATWREGIWMVSARDEI